MNYRQRRYRFGLWAEFLCRWHLRLRGYQIRAIRTRTPAGEIDIIASRGSVVAMIEVKARRTQDSAALALGMRQRKRITHAAHHLLAQWPDLMQGTTIRFDLMLVTPWRLPHHIANAWDAA